MIVNVIHIRHEREFNTAISILSKLGYRLNGKAKKNIRGNSSSGVPMGFVPFLWVEDNPKILRWSVGLEHLVSYLKKNPEIKPLNFDNFLKEYSIKYYNETGKEVVI